MSFEEIGERRSLPSRVVEAVTASILSGERREGEALPTEPELAREFGVSRSVIRDAVRMLVAKGLVEVRRGKGTFVASSRGAAFAEAMLLALGRRGASAWDVEEFAILSLPGILALAAERADEADREAVRAAAEAYLAVHAGHPAEEPGGAGSLRLKQLFGAFMRRIFEATGNEVIILVGETLIGIRSFRDVEEGVQAAEDRRRIVESENRIIRGLAEAVASGDAEKARAQAATMRDLRPDLRRRLEETPIGAVPRLTMAMLGLDGDGKA